MQSVYIRKYNYVDSFSCYEKNEARYFNQTKRKLEKNDLSKKKEKKWVSDNLVTDYFWMSMSHFRLPLL